MVLTGLRGALGFLTTLPVGRSEAAWKAFAARPAVMVPVGYVLGGVLALPLFLGLPATLVGFLFVLGIAVFAGINNLDGLLDVADGVATHGDRAAARAAMKDSDVGVAAVLALGLVLLGLFAAGTALADMGGTGAAVVIAAEVGATPAQTALAWLMHRDGVTAPIVGARTVEQLEENLAAATISLGQDQVDRLTEAKPGPYEGL